MASVPEIGITVPDAVIAAFCAKWHIREFSLFGSILRGDFGPQSDVDVLVSFRKGAPIGLWELDEMTEELEGIYGRKVDLVEKEALVNPFRRQAILSEHEVIHASE